MSNMRCNTEPLGHLVNCYDDLLQVLVHSTIHGLVSTKLEFDWWTKALRAVNAGKENWLHHNHVGDGIEALQIDIAYLAREIGDKDSGLLCALGNAKINILTAIQAVEEENGVAPSALFGGLSAAEVWRRSARGESIPAVILPGDEVIGGESSKKIYDISAKNFGLAGAVSYTVTRYKSGIVVIAVTRELSVEAAAKAGIVGVAVGGKVRVTTVYTMWSNEWGHQSEKFAKALNGEPPGAFGPNGSLEHVRSSTTTEMALRASASVSGSIQNDFVGGKATAQFGVTVGFGETDAHHETTKYGFIKVDGKVEGDISLLQGAFEAHGQVHCEVAARLSAATGGHGVALDIDAAIETKSNTISIGGHTYSLEGQYDSMRVKFHARFDSHSLPQDIVDSMNSPDPGQRIQGLQRAVAMGVNIDYTVEYSNSNSHSLGFDTGVASASETTTNSAWVVAHRGTTHI
jgi:hypothetical protein